MPTNASGQQRDFQSCVGSSILHVGTKEETMRNFILGYIVGAFLTSFALSYNSAYTKAVRQEAIRSVYNPAKTETQKVEPMYSA
jgi:hypothetical protein